MDIYVVNTKFETIGVIDNASSVIWTERYNEPGDFELYVAASNEAIQLLRPDYYLVRNDTDCVMIIERLEIQTDVENGNYLIVTGKSLESILYRRIIWQQTLVRGKVDACIQAFIYQNIITPTVASGARLISNFRWGSTLSVDETMTMQRTGDNLGETISQICKTYGIGYRITLENGLFIFYLYQGTDRSYNQTENPYVVFSPEFENLLTSDYIYDKTNCKNIALIAGEGEGLARKTISVGVTDNGLSRREIYIDSRNASTNDGEISDGDYLNQLAEEGREALKEYPIDESFTGTVDYEKQYKFRQDYFMGDVVQVVNEYGMTATPRITEIIESEDENGYTLIPTFEYNGGAE